MIDELGISDFDYSENSYSRYDKKYTVKSLIALAENYTPFKLPLAAIDLSTNPWGNQTIHTIAYHIRRMNKSDDFPIILDDTGFVCDGWHRLLKAVINGDKYIMAIRLPIMPDPC